MKITLLSLSLLILLVFCNTLKITSEQKNISSLAIDYTLSEKVNPVYKTLIDSTFDVAIAKFNSENHAYTAHKKAAGESQGLTFDFTKGKFVKPGGITAGYIVSGIGLIATPATILIASGGTWVGLFYYLPSDKFEFSVSLSPSLAANPGRKLNHTVATGALFSSKPKRLKRISKRLGQAINKMLVKVDKQVKKGT